MQAVILAAGMGKRLKKLTADNTKCMIKVNGVTIIERMLAQLSKYNFNKVIIVVGYKAKELISYISGLRCELPIEYVTNDVYYETNNIYSLFLARGHLLLDDTILLESDLVFEDAILHTLINNPYPDLALVDKYENWMDGTVVTLGSDNKIRSFLSSRDIDYSEGEDYYKTLNIYKFSRSFSESHYVPFLEAYCSALGYQEYYEQVLKVISLLESPRIRVLPIKNMDWYEIDDAQDLNIAEAMFAKDAKLEKMELRFGGYWRYPKLLDFCYLVNPYFPPKRVMNELKSSFEELICSYPSGQAVNNLLAAKYFGLPTERMVVGNGASELIKNLMDLLEGKLGVQVPTFEEYPRRKKTDIVRYLPAGTSFTYTADGLMDYYNENEIDHLLLINPDNPSGNYIERGGMERLLSWSREKNIRLIVDESFVGFANPEDSLLTDQTLEDNPQLVVINSISKSFGVPGLRLGVLASADEKLIKRLSKEAAIWNINSFAERFLQIVEKYKPEYLASMSRFADTRAGFLLDIGEIGYLRPIPSRASFVMCGLSEGLSSRALARLLLDEYHILIKDLSLKDNFKKQFVRIAIKLPEENRRLMDALRSIEPEQIKL
ncbi:MAG: aminotransferase class I/II-fold pyridoxal phosphate-dependent enzyme [Oscillospiraceae bacterium]|nr:aminotransferase class I/II-fold pyridoxal phosphate-dependent enzyme [Oscillospiraceae bacterium]